MKGRPKWEKLEHYKAVQERMSTRVPQIRPAVTQRPIGMGRESKSSKTRKDCWPSFGQPGHHAPLGALGKLYLVYVSIVHGICVAPVGDTKQLLHHILGHRVDRVFGSFQAPPNRFELLRGFLYRWPRKKGSVQEIGQQKKGKKTAHR
jgi:hypothetical protein